MTMLERQVRATQHRLWINRGFSILSTMLCGGAGVFAALVLVVRLFDLTWPLAWIGLALAAVAASAALVRLMVTREGPSIAAARLDEAAGLRERLSSAHYCTTTDDPFARAVVSDAELVSGSLSARQHIRLVMPRSAGWTTAVLLLAALMFLVPPGYLAPTEATEKKEQVVQAKQAKLAVKRQMDRVQKLVQDNPVLDDLKEKLSEADKRAGGKLQRPADLRHEAIKKIDKLSDAVKQKRKNDKYAAVHEMRKMLRGLPTPKQPDAATRKLNKALAKGDFKTASEEIKALQEQLATLKSQDDKELAARMSKQLQELAKALSKLATKQQLAKKLAEAGLTKEEIKRALESLKKRDLDQLKKQLAEKGLDKKQIERLAKQLQSKQMAASTAKKLAGAMKQGAKFNNPGQMGGAMAGLTMAADQLSELEQLEQEMAQLDAALAELNSSSNSLSKPCSQCNGVGCSRCDSSSRGMGGQGRGRGGLATEEETVVRFKTQRGKVHTGKGAIIGQFLVDGEQVKGEMSTSFSEVVTAAEHDASDRINRNRIPRQYHKAVKAYFSNMRRTIEEEGDKNGNAKPDAAGPGDKPASGGDGE